jgi:hypothetical protein
MMFTKDDIDKAPAGLRNSFNARSEERAPDHEFFSNYAEMLRLKNHRLLVEETEDGSVVLWRCSTQDQERIAALFEQAAKDAKPKARRTKRAKDSA